MTPLLAEQFRTDPRVAEGMRLILAAMRDQQRVMTGVRPASADRQTAYGELLRRFEHLRAGSLYYPYLGTGIGAGPFVELADGSVKLDFISGIGVHYLGHGDRRVVEAALAAALQDVTMQGNLQQNVDAVRFCETLLALARREGLSKPDANGSATRLEHGFVSSSGAMANENALKIILQKRTPATRLLAFEHTFAGRTLALAAITDRPDFRQNLPTLLAVDYVPFVDPTDVPGSTARAIQVLRSHLERYPGQYAAMCLELILGEGGYIGGERNFFRPLLEVLKPAGVAVLFDEIQTFGRTSCPFAFQHFGLDAYVDVVTVGKLTQVCATLFTAEYAPRPGLLSQTFTGATAAILVGQRILDELRAGGYFGEEGRIASLSQYFVHALSVLAERHPCWLRGPFGCGAMIGLTPFDGSAESVKAVLQRCFHNGLIGFSAGARPARVRFLMPVGATTETHIDLACDILETTLGELAGRFDTPAGTA